MKDLKYFWLVFVSLLVTLPSAHSQILELYHGGSNAPERAKELYRDHMGNYYQIGSLGINPGSVYGYDYPLSSAVRHFVVKLDDDFNAIWFKTFELGVSTSTSGQHMLAVDEFENLYVSLYTFTTKFDKDGNQMWSVPFGCFELSVNDQGNIELLDLWKTDEIFGITITEGRATRVILRASDGGYIEHFTLDFPHYIKVVLQGKDKYGNYFGYREKDLDGEVGGPNEAIELFLVDSSGNFIKSGVLAYGRTYGDHNPSNNGGHPYGDLVYDDMNEKFYINGRYRATPNLFDSTTFVREKYMLKKFDFDFNQEAAIVIGEDFFGVRVRLHTFKGDLYFAGTTSNTFTEYNFGGNNQFFHEDDIPFYGRMSSDLTLKWYESWDHPDAFYANSVNGLWVDDSGIYLAGGISNFSFDGYDFDWPGYDDIYTAKVANYESKGKKLKGFVFSDENENGSFDSNERKIPFHPVSLGQDYIKYTDAEGNFETAFYQLGTHKVYNHHLPNSWTTNTTDTLIYEITSTTGLLETAEIGINIAPEIHDLKIDIDPIGPARRAFKAGYKLTYSNVGEFIQSGSIKMTSNLDIRYVNSSLNPTFISADSIVWNFDDLHPFESRSILLTDSLALNVPLLSSAVHFAEIRPLDIDDFPQDNQDTCSQFVIGSIDPNDITVTPSCDITPDFINSNKELEYNIRFQNVGNDTAFNVWIRNIVDPNLDFGTFRLGTFSHDVDVSFQDSLLTFTFPDIHLPDSIIDFQGSNGFIKYYIKPLNTVTIGDELSAQAAIYFDLNDPVITNREITSIVEAESLFSFASESASCPLTHDGIIEIIPVCDDFSFVQYSLNNGPSQQEPLFINLPSGMYTPTVIVDGEIYELDSIFINSPELSIESYTIVSNACPGGNSAQIEINTISTNNIAFYIMNNQDTSTINTFFGLTAGTYNFSIVDNQGCVFTDDDLVLIGDPEIITATFDITDASNNDGSIIVNASGGTGVFLYSANGSAFQESNVFDNLSPGIYEIIIEDENGCLISQEVEVKMATSTINISTVKVELYPNPNQGLLKINTKNINLSNGRISIFNSQGIRVYLSKQSQSSQVLDLGHLPPGFYLIQCEFENLLFLEKLILQQ